MAKYLIEGSYSHEGLKGLVKDGGTGRKAAIEAASKAFGGRIESIYYAFGTSDVYVIVDAPDNVSVAAFALAVGATRARGALCNRGRPAGRSQEWARRAILARA